MLRVAVALVKPVGLSTQQHEPVQLWRQDAEVTKVAAQGQVEGNAVDGDARVLSVCPVHIGEECNATCEESQQHHHTIHLGQPAVLQPQLEWSQRNTEVWEKNVSETVNTIYQILILYTVLSSILNAWNITSRTVAFITSPQLEIQYVVHSVASITGVMPEQAQHQLLFFSSFK